MAMRKATSELTGHVDQLGLLRQWELDVIEEFEPLLAALKAKAVKDIEDERVDWDAEEHAHAEQNFAAFDEVAKDILSTKGQR